MFSNRFGIFVSCSDRTYRIIKHSELSCTIGQKVSRAWDKRVARFISYMHHIAYDKQFLNVDNKASDCKLPLFQMPTSQEACSLQVYITWCVVRVRTSYMWSNVMVLVKADCGFSQQ